MFLQGKVFPLGSVHESIAISAQRRRNQAQFMTTMSIINAIILVGNKIASAASGGDSSSSSGDDLKKQCDALRDVLMPELAEDATTKANKVREMLEREANQGPLTVRSAMRDKKSRRR